ncbi:hypothetical protein QLH51_04310 [Sphingomonas sp. 2R-10]|uniref:hypothetical protein n=1 Tax=Sphingomonas sp. 2R-10 TaxID=3045148 RepID=UPI0024BABD6C|nr:hypothetical protein [Sphingomonas sp. 2R-10]MDJ0276027.1 hypothetical protein [Sphingomonas sp. 2R-10]
MARTPTKPDDLDAINARREALLAELAQVDEQARVAKEAARDAGRPILLAALDRVKIARMEKAEARIIANTIGRLGGKAVAEHLGALPDS